jgi:hypothetical protein
VKLNDRAAMETLKSKLTRLLPPGRKVVTENYTTCTFIPARRDFVALLLNFLLLSFIFSSPSSAMQKKDNNNDVIKDKRYELLEKLEKGTSISSEEIRSSLGNITFNLPEEDNHFIFGYHDFYFVPPLPPFPGPFYHRYHDDDDYLIITDKDIKEIHRHLNESLEELRKDIESFRDSDEFLKIHDELQKWNDGFRRELDKMKEELKKSANESKSKSSTHTHM